MQRIIAIVLSVFLLVNGLKENDSQLSKSVNDFQINFYKKLTENTNDNVFCSGFSISTVLSMLLACAQGETAREIRSTLKYQNLTDNEIQESYHRLLTNLRGNHSGYTLDIANSVWIQEGFNVLEEFKDIVQRVFYGQEELVNFATSLATDQINEWVNNQTKGKIPKLFNQPLDASTSLVLANAMHFKGDWAEKFSEELTEEKSFQTGNGSVQVDMMKISKRFRYTNSSELKAQIIEIPYQGNNVSMVVILPHANIGIKNFEKNLTAKKLEKQLFRMGSWKVTLSLPKFKLSTEYNLNDILKNMGMVKAYTDADFSGITGDTSLTISKAIQKAIIEVNEEGTVAAAASGVAVAESAAFPEMQFTANRPFLFLIGYKPTRTILFMGKIVNPNH